VSRIDTVASERIRADIFERLPSPLEFLRYLRTATEDTIVSIRKANGIVLSAKYPVSMKRYFTIGMAIYIPRSIDTTKRFPL